MPTVLRYIWRSVERIDVVDLEMRLLLECNQLLWIDLKNKCLFFHAFANLQLFFCELFNFDRIFRDMWGFLHKEVNIVFHVIFTICHVCNRQLDNYHSTTSSSSMLIMQTVRWFFFGFILSHSWECGSSCHRLHLTRSFHFIVVVFMSFEDEIIINRWEKRCDINQTDVCSAVKRINDMRQKDIQVAIYAN